MFNSADIQGEIVISLAGAGGGFKGDFPKYFWIFLDIFSPFSFPLIFFSAIRKDIKNLSGCIKFKRIEDDDQFSFPCVIHKIIKF